MLTIIDYSDYNRTETEILLFLICTWYIIIYIKKVYIYMYMSMLILGK